MKRLVVTSALTLAGLLGSSVARADDVNACVGAFDNAQKAAAAGQLKNARDLLEVCSGSTCPVPLRADCIQRREDLERVVPTATFVVRDTHGDDVEAAVTVDGAPMPALGRAIALDPGPHAVVFTTRDGKKHEQRIVMAEGEKARVVVLHVGAVPHAAPAASPEIEEKPSTTVPWIVLGTGAGLVLVGGAVAFAAAVDWADTKQLIQVRFDFCSTADCYARVSSDYSDAKDRTFVREGVGFGIMTVGLITGAVGTVLLATSTSRSSSSSSRASLVPLIGTTNGAALSGSF